MYLVGNDENTVALAYLAHLLKFYGSPYSSSRIMRIAQDEHLRLFIGTMMLESLKVDYVVIARERERCFFRKASIIADGREESIIYRCLNQYLISRLCHSFDDG